MMRQREKILLMPQIFPTPTTAESLAKLRLARSSGMGSITLRKLMQRYETASHVLARWSEFAKPSMVLCTEDAAQRELEKLRAAGGWMVVWGEEGYPAALQELPDAPIVLSGLGDAQFLSARQVAMVGNRAASAAGLAWSKTLASDLAKAGVVVTSGLARGIDSVAHEGALSANGGTVAVVAGGVDHIYPPENANLRQRIIAHGCVVSEQPFGMVPLAQFFPRRNRIIAGLSVGVVVSEASRHSGSLITAECALGYGRDVWAVPGSPSDARAGGPNWLLKNGAHLVESAADILAHLPAKPAPFVPRVQQQKIQPDLFANADEADDVFAGDEGEIDGIEPSLRQKVFGLLGAVSVSFDTLVRMSGVDEAALNGVLIELELDGHASRAADGGWVRG
ncbi:MAG: DNA-protecting protein DprA [Proteobacteria bacterium]|nr:DNA-protecting protein DprA [Pseudomonadota bacterium]